MRVICAGLWRCQQDHDRVASGSLVRATNQLAADAAALKSFVHREIGQVRAVAEVGQRAGEADEQPAGSGGDDHVGVFDHSTDCLE
jgi:hypothetical protein